MECPATSGGPWRHYPWLIGLLLAPLLAGAVTTSGQALVGLLLAASLILLAPEMGRYHRPLLGPAWRWAALVLLLAPLLPLPAGGLAWIDPQRVALAHEFPIEANQPVRWLTWSLSPAGTIQRVWELGLIFACFCLARHGARQPGFARHLSMVVGTGIVLLAASDLWVRLGGPTALRGIGRLLQAPGQGPYANHNHFANWLYVAAVFVLGWCLRNTWPLHSARAQPLPSAEVRYGDAVFLFGAVLLGLALAVASGSRAGWAAFLAGPILWVVVLVQRARQRTRWFFVGMGLVLILACVLATGDFLFHRLVAPAAVSSTLSTKAEVWKQAVGIWGKFPLLGAGWGSFVTAFGLFKTGFGSLTVWHAENDYVQLLLETGLLGCIVYVGAIAGVCGKLAGWAWQKRLAEPELVFGALAALAVFAVHALVDFVFQITANAMLAAALLGVVAGLRDEANQPMLVAPLSLRRILGNFGLAGVLLLAAAMQGLACWQGFQAAGAANALEAVNQNRAALSVWPWDIQRQITLARATVNLAAVSASEDRPAHRRQIAATRQGLDRALVWDPLNWQLRLERAWLDLVFATNRDRAKAEAWQVIQLNPLQPEIPLRFARYYALHDPGEARRFLHSPALAAPGSLERALELVWEMDHEPSSLWPLVPNTVAGLTTLGDFAVQQRLFGLAAQAYQQLGPRVEGVTLAEKFLQAQRPDLALAALPRPLASARAKLVAARASLQSGDLPAALQQAESICLDSGVRSRILQAANTDAPLGALRREWQQKPTDAPAALRLAEKLYQMPLNMREASQLQQLAERFPDQWRLTWLACQTERDLGHYEAAAQLALELAGRIVAQQNRVAVRINPTPATKTD